jgi:hypothetical protein
MAKTGTLILLEGLTWLTAAPENVQLVRDRGVIYKWVRRWIATG